MCYYVKMTDQPRFTTVCLRTELVEEIRQLQLHWSLLRTGRHLSVSNVVELLLQVRPDLDREAIESFRPLENLRTGRPRDPKIVTFEVKNS